MQSGIFGHLSLTLVHSFALRPAALTPNTVMKGLYVISITGASDCVTLRRALHSWRPAVSWHICDQQKVEPASISTGMPLSKESKNIGAFPLSEEAQEVIHTYCGIIFNIIFSILASEPDWEISSSFVATNNFEWLSCLYFKNCINSGFLIKVSRAACLVMGNWQSAPINLIGASLKRKCIIQFMEPLFSGMSVI